MKRVSLLATALLISSSLFTQDLADKKYDFTMILNDNMYEEPQFTATNFYTQLNKNTVLSFNSSIEFPIIEEKDTWKFGDVRDDYETIINLDNFYQSIPKFTNFSPYAQKQMDILKGRQVKILRGYDFCGRPLY